MFLLQKWMWSPRMRTGSAFIHLWLSQNHKDIAKSSFSKECCPTASERAVSALLKMYVKRQQGYLLSVQMQPKDAKRISHLGQGAGEYGCYVNCNNFPNIPLRSGILLPMKHMSTLSTHHYWLMPEKQLFPQQEVGSGTTRCSWVNCTMSLACLLGYEVCSPHKQDEERGSQQWILPAV